MGLKVGLGVEEVGGGRAPDLSRGHKQVNHSESYEGLKN